tara:strand:+ start:14875 stop:15099 length:225 start_codon:yes stop_codon:yes gene_type:complete
MKAKSVGHAEWEILNYLINGENGYMKFEGLDDLARDLGVFDCEHAEKRFKTASVNVLKVLENMLSKREKHRPGE